MPVPLVTAGAGKPFRKDAMSGSIKLCSVTLECPDAEDHWRVYADPAGHPFCLSAEDVPDQA